MENSLQQYLDIYSQNRDLIWSKSAPGFNSLRDRAFENLKVFGFPRKGAENYEMSDISELLSTDFGLNIARLPLDVNPAEGFRCGLPHLSSALFFMLDDRWAESRGARNNLPDGVEIGPLSAVLSENVDDNEGRLYGSLADMANPIVALNSMLVQEGMFLRVKKGVKVERPIQLVNILEHTLPLMAMRRLLLIVEEEAEVTFLTCSHTSSVGIPMGTVSVAEVFAARNSRIDFYDMEESSENTVRLTALYLRQDEKSDVLIENFTLHNGSTRNEYHCRFNGPGASLRLYGVGIEGRSSQIDNYSRICHDAEECHTEELFKYILDEESRGAFTGLIYVAPGSSKTEAYQNNRNLVGSDKARMFSKPQLEIYNDDVKCSHGSATGQLDEMQLFYLRSRGIGEEEARKLLKQAFMADVIEGVRLPVLKDRLHSLVEKRLVGQDTHCRDCEICK